METKEGVIIIVGICVFVLLIGLLKKRADIIINFVLRCFLGVISIYFLNEFLNVQEINVYIGMNPVSVLTVGTLGISGVALLYGIGFTGLL